MKTGGFVVWRKKNALVVYRGCDYTLRQKDDPKRHHDFLRSQQNNSSTYTFKKTSAFSSSNSSRSSVDVISGESSEDDSLTINESLFEREANRLLDDLGPRYVDWWWPKPLPVDADLLPEVVPGFKPPFRLCPPRSRSKLTDDELTHLRKLARSLPTHFVLGKFLVLDDAYLVQMNCSMNFILDMFAACVCRGLLYCLSTDFLDSSYLYH